MAWGSAYFVISLDPEFPLLFVENGIPYSDALVGTFSVWFWFISCCICQ
jgi:hypothetical protein